MVTPLDTGSWEGSLTRLSDIHLVLSSTVRRYSLGRGYHGNPWYRRSDVNRKRYRERVSLSSPRFFPVSTAWRAKYSLWDKSTKANRSDSNQNSTLCNVYFCVSPDRGRENKQNRTVINNNNIITKIVPRLQQGFGGRADLCSFLGIHN